MRPCATTVSFDVVIVMPASPLSAVTVAVTSVFAIAPPFLPTKALSAMAKHAACAAAISSSGLVTPSASPMRRGKLTGRLKAPLPAFAVPLPSMIEPSQFTVTLRENVAIYLLLSPLAVTASCTKTPEMPSAIQTSSTQYCPGAGFIGYASQTLLRAAASTATRLPDSASAPTMIVQAPPNAVAPMMT